jgi:hypothetical protein
MALVLPGLLLIGSVLFLPLGLFLALMGVGVMVWGVAGEPFEAHPASETQPVRAATPVVLHMPWDCRWTVRGYRLTNVSERDQPETPWICVREPGRRRPVTEADCAQCPEWEPNPTITGWRQRHAA